MKERIKMDAVCVVRFQMEIPIAEGTKKETALKHMEVVKQHFAAGVKEVLADKFDFSKEVETDFPINIEVTLKKFKCK